MGDADDVTERDHREFVRETGDWSSVAEGTTEVIASRTHCDCDIMLRSMMKLRLNRQGYECMARA
jgi:hypothetical protein